MKIGLISDTHDNTEKIYSFVRICKDYGITLAIHSGDVVTSSAVEAFRGVRLVGVLGNNDLDKEILAPAFEQIGGELKGEFCEISEGGLTIAVYHGTDVKKKDVIIQSGKYDVVVCGHTHRAESKRFGNTQFINPGTANGWFFGYKATAVVYDTETRTSQLLSL